MEIYDLCFNAVVSNMNDACVSFLCKRKCKFIETLEQDLNVSIDANRMTYKKSITGDTEAVEEDKKQLMCLGEVFKKAPVMRVPTAYIQDKDYYCDITLLFIDESTIQVVIYKMETFPQGVDIVEGYDAYKLFYEYVGSVSDLKTRLNYECKFMNNMHASVNGAVTDEVFKEHVDRYIVQKMFD